MGADPDIAEQIRRLRIELVLAEDRGDDQASRLIRDMLTDLRHQLDGVPDG